MSTQALYRLTADEYLGAEVRSETRREFVRGQVFDMVGGTDRHNLISLNIASVLRERLRGGACRVFMADMKVRVEAVDVFYYPDVLVTCDPADRQPYYKERPALIVKVLSDTTEGTDRREKFLAYELLASLREYVLVHQSRREVEAFRRETRETAWVKSTHTREDEVSFRSVGVSLTLSEIYEGLDSR